MYSRNSCVWEWLSVRIYDEQCSHTLNNARHNIFDNPNIIEIPSKSKITNNVGKYIHQYVIRKK